MALSSKGFEGLGPVFRVQTSAQSEEEAPQAQPGKVRNSPRFGIQCMPMSRRIPCTPDVDEGVLLVPAVFAGRCGRGGGRRSSDLETKHGCGHPPQSGQVLRRLR